MSSFASFLLTLLLVAGVLSAPTGQPVVLKRDIPQALFDDLVRYTKYSSGAYQPACTRPLGNTRVLQIDERSTDTQAYIARDDARKEIVVAFRGSLQLPDFLTDLDFKLVAYTSPGVASSLTGGVQTHSGFLRAFNSVAALVISTVSAQLAAHPDYTLFSTGHSLGGALASLGGMSLAANFPGRPLKVFTFGQPRTGNPAYANLVERLVGVDNIFRAVHTTDGVPTLLPQWLGYRHHGAEYWHFNDPSVPSNVRKCDGQEDPTCSNSVPSLGINPPHIVYFGQLIALDLTVCLRA